MALLMAHERGHFLMTVRYRIPASYPIFLPMPSMLTGTMGAVIGMEGSRANRRQMFDIGLAGPLAGLVLTVPLVVWTLSDVGERAAALDSRAFRSRARRTTLDAPVAATWERALMVLAALGSLLIAGSFLWP
jgi:Zn-dependent protease